MTETRTYQNNDDETHGEEKGGHDRWWCSILFTYLVAPHSYLT
jgi:hypothetical protein